MISVILREGAIPDPAVQTGMPVNSESSYSGNTEQKNVGFFRMIWVSKLIK